ARRTARRSWVQTAYRSPGSFEWIRAPNLRSTGAGIHVGHLQRVTPWPWDEGRRRVVGRVGSGEEVQS
ncbi:unnamed protein product, partial [Sphacelaria rigidula]